MWTVFLYALITALATGLGALPFAFKKNLSRSWRAKANAIAASLMLAASFGLIYEGLQLEGEQIYQFGVVGGILVGLVFIFWSDKFLSRYEHLSIANVKGGDAKKILLILGVMTIHSFSEGVAIGVSFGPSESFGIFIALAMALHNIPEGLAISTVMCSKGIKRYKAALRSIFSSLPQPLMAIPAFMFVQVFTPFLSMGLGFAAGAMIWMSVSELLPDAYEGAPKETIATIMTLGIAAMTLFQIFLG